MIIIKEKALIADKILGEQTFNKQMIYRWLNFCVLEKVDDGKLIYNLLTKQLVYLESEEAEIFCGEQFHYIENATFEWLIKNLFLVPISNDDLALSESLDNTVSLITKKNSITRYTIMTTTDCNARCFYCYELGRKRFPMSEDTAIDVAKYIIKKSKGEKVYITWFGGEPLYNDTVINIICQYLKDHKIDFATKMISNGYLFNENIIKNAKDIWNLQKVQISLDGTEEIYNKCKAYIYRDNNSPFQIVIKNIELLLKNSISVNVRLNMDLHNEKDLYKLCDFLSSKFSAYNNFKAYVALLFDDCGVKPNHRTEKQRHEIMQKYFALQEYMIKKGIVSITKLSEKIRTNNCMADNDSAVVINPNGDLGKCEHFSESDFFGSIYNEDYNHEMILNWKKKRRFEQCAKCAFYPECFLLEQCPDITHSCNEDDRLLLEQKTHMAMKQAYNEYKETLYLENV